MSCPFCPQIEKFTEWYWETDDGIVVCEDLNAKEFKYRILIVGSGKKYHKPLGQYSREEIKRFIKLGQNVAQAHIKRGMAKRIVEIDTTKHSMPDHWHVQYCMR